ncbi:MAG TPA: hypothetical protein VHB20_13570 [Verrucomicrobiae bacterium]|jgi:hypothetical protein|nr:hypothetical protein [Verrucomicrobiae bacterium]
MKRFVKMFAVTGLALSVLTLTTPKAEAHGGFGIAAGVLGGLAVGTAIGVTVAHAAPAPYYVYPGPTYAYAAPAPQACVQAPVVVAPPVYAAPVCPTPVVYAAPYYRPVVRVGFGWGRPYYHYRRW